MIRKSPILFSLLIILVLSLAACSSAGTAAPSGGAESEVAKPSNPGGSGDAVNLTGDVTAGQEVFKTYCTVCHGEQGKGGVENPGSDDGTVPPLSPIDETMVNADYKTFATNIDLFIEHGSTPEGSSPAKQMLAFGDNKVLTSQQIADVIAYIISLNK